MRRERLFTLPFDPVMQSIEHGLQSFSMQSQYLIVIRDLVGYLLEELSVKIWDRESISSIDLAVAYLKQCHVDETVAREFAHHVMNGIFMTVVSYFPTISFQELSAGRYLLDQDNATLLTYLPHKDT